MTDFGLSRVAIEQREEQTLARYASRSSLSRGRQYDQTQHPLRTCFQRDRDRIIHCSAFRRMAYKTQVFIPHETDHFRTRLTHTIEVAQISRTLARAMRLNEDLTEAIALVHDLGHTPFGHSGEDILDDLLADAGGFNHNRQSLRIVDHLEHRYPDHPGLNLSFEVREGIAKHETKVKIDLAEFAAEPQPTLEAALVDSADEIAYNAHDIDDGLVSGLITIDDLRRTDFWDFLTDGLSDEGDSDQFRYGLVRHILDITATDLLIRTSQNMVSNNITDLDSVRNCSTKLCGYSPDMAVAVKALKTFLKERLYHHRHLIERADRAEEIIRTLYKSITKDHSLMPDRYRAMLTSERSEIVVADYVAGMTDRFATQMAEQLK